MRFLFGYLFILTLILPAQAEYLFVEGKSHYKKKWIDYSDNYKVTLTHLIQKIAQSKTGKELLVRASKKAESYGKTLSQVIQPGDGSITDTTLIRRFIPSDPDNVSYESRSMVYINRNLNTYDAILDLSHELTHFVYREGFNPYKKNFSLDSFIKSTVEGRGGEVQAFMMECKILYELFPKKITSRYNCKKIIDPQTGQLSRSLAIKRFYQLGPYYSKFKGKLENHGLAQNFPQINNTGVSFVSSAYGMPYPVAAYHEYMTVLTKVCENDKKRIAYMGRSAAPERSPASFKVAKAKQDYLDRCSAVMD